MGETRRIREVRDNPERGRYEAVFDDGVIAYKLYRIRGGTIALRQTVVPPTHVKLGAAALLNRFARDDARRRDLEIVPGCPFIED